MSRYINIGDQNGRNAEVLFSGITKKPIFKMVTSNGKEIRTLRVIKGTAANSYEGLMLNHKTPEAVMEEILKGDPEIDVLMTGRYISSSSRVYVDQKLQPVARIHKVEKVYDVEGNLKEERVPKENNANILGDFPIKPTGKLFPKKSIYNKLVFAKKYQLSHVNGLTFDFLFDMAKTLHESDSIAMLGAGPKGNEPLVFQDGGKTYRAFMEGRVKDESYLLILHLSNIELKSIT